jgi:CBS domain-containing protein
MARKIVPDIVSNQSLAILPANTTVREAAKIMAQRRIGVVMVGSSDNLQGIFSERDMTFRVVARGVDPDTATLDEVMTKSPTTIAPADSPDDALRLMREQGFRHLPVVDRGTVVAMVSIRDLYAAVQSELEDSLHEHEAFIYGGGYALGA